MGLSDGPGVCDRSCANLLARIRAEEIPLEQPEGGSLQPGGQTVLQGSDREEC